MPPIVGSPVVVKYSHAGLITISAVAASRVPNGTRKPASTACTIPASAAPTSTLTTGSSTRSAVSEVSNASGTWSSGSSGGSS